MKVIFKNSSTGIYFNCSLNDKQQKDNNCAVCILPKQLVSLELRFIDSYCYKFVLLTNKLYFLSICSIVRQENERGIRENLERTLMMKNLTELNLQRQQQILNQAQQQQH